MPRDDLEKLLGGYATNTLTDEERKALFEAALTDQALFNTLADEQALKELLDDPRSRRHLLAALEAKEKKKAWFQQPWSWALAGSLAAGVLAVTLVVREASLPPLGQPERLEVSKQQAVSEPAPAAAPQADSISPRAQKRNETNDRSAPAATTKPPLKPDVRAKAPVPAQAKREEAPPAAETPPPEKDAPLTTPTPPGRVSASVPTQPLSKEQQPVQGSVEQLQGEQHARALFYAAAEPARTVVVPKTAPEETPGTKQSDQGVSGFLGKERKATTSDALARKALMPLGLRYSVAKQRLTIEANDNAYLYVLGRNTAGALMPLFPGKGTGAEIARIEKWRRYTVEAPSDVTQVTIALFRHARPDLQGAPVSPPSATTPLLVEKAEEAAPTQESERAVYVVAPRSDPSAGIVFETTLASR
jgi:hypothetical protein